MVKLQENALLGSSIAKVSKCLSLIGTKKALRIQSASVAGVGLEPTTSGL